MLDLNFVNQTSHDTNHYYMAVKKSVQSEIHSSSVSSDVFNDHFVAVDDDDCVSYSEQIGESVDLTTRQFFPVSSYSEMEEELGSGVMTSSVMEVGTDWLNLKVPESEVKMPVQKVRKSRRGPPSRSSQYRGVTFYRRTGRWESHIWDCGKQLYLGGFDTSHSAARAYDRAAIKFRGPDADINFELSDYDEDMRQMKNLSKEEFIQVLRRQSNGFSRGSSKYRGVTLHKCGRWEARMGQLLGKKAYDQAAIKLNGRDAVTNFEPSVYGVDMNSGRNDEATGHNLDLNLWVSPIPKRNRVQNVDIGLKAHGLPSGKIPKVGGLALTSIGVQSRHDSTAFPQQFPAWHSMYSGHRQSYEEMTAGLGSARAVPSQGGSNAGWQMQMGIGHHQVEPVPITSTAASSGFSSSATRFTDSLFLSNINMQINTSSHNTFSPMPTGTFSNY